VCVTVKLPWLFGTAVVLFWKLLGVSCLLLCATVCELRTRRNSQVLEIADCVSFERVGLFEFIELILLVSCEWIVSCLKSYLQCRAVVV